MPTKAFAIACLFVLFAVSPGFANPIAADWNLLLGQARDAEKEGDIPYSLFKLRQAWFALANQDLNSEPHIKVKSAMVEVLKQHNLRYVRNQARRIQEEYSMEHIESLLKQREFNSSNYEYSIEMLIDGSLSLSLNGLEEPSSGMPVCQNYLNKLTSEERAQVDTEWNSKNLACIKANDASKKALCGKMPIIVKPGSQKYDDLLFLCRPIKPGEKRQKTGFDVSGFVPLGMSQSPVI